MPFDLGIFGQGVASSAVSSLIDLGTSSLKAKQQYNFQKNLLAKQHDYELENLAAQDKYQRALAEDASLLRKSSLMQAGYSTADPEGTGTVAPSVSSPSTSASGSFSMPSAGYAPGMSVSDLANAELLQSQADLNRIEAKYRANLLEGQIGKLNQEIDQIKQKLPLEVDQIKQNVDVLRSQKKLNDNEANKLLVDIDKISEQLKGIKIDNKYKADLNEWQVNKLKSEVFKLSQEGKFEEVKAELARVGIIVGADWMTQLAAVIHQGSAPELIENIKQLVKDLFSPLGSVGAPVVDSIIEGAADIGKGVKKAGDMVVPDKATEVWKETMKDKKINSHRFDFMDK